MSTEDNNLQNYYRNNIYYDTNTNNLYVVDGNGNNHLITTTNSTYPINHSVYTVTKPKYFESEKISSSLIDIIKDELKISD